MRRLVDRLTLGRRRRYRALMRRLDDLDRLDGSGSGSRRRRRSWPLLVAAVLAVTLAVAWPTELAQVRDSISGGGSGGGDSPDAAGRSLNELSELPPLPADAAAAPLGTPPPAPTGAGTFRFFFTQPGTDDPVTYDPCRPIHYVLRVEGAPREGRRLVESAIAEVSNRTGLQFAYDGETTEAPGEQREPVQPDRYGNRWAPVLVAWSDPEETPALEGRVAGVGGSTYVEPQPDAMLRYVTGQVVLDAPDIRDVLRREANGFAEARAIVAHEMAHVVGLEHVDDRDELMYPENTGRTKFGTGDLQGLERLGRGRCHRDT